VRLLKKHRSWRRLDISAGCVAADLKGDNADEQTGINIVRRAANRCARSRKNAGFGRAALSSIA